VRSVAAIPAAGLLAGAAAGLLLSESPFSTWGPALAGPTLLLSICAGIAGVVMHRSRVVIASVILGFFIGGVAIASVAWQRAWRPPLRVAFEGIARTQRGEAEAQGRRMPEDDEAFADVEGVLRSDATVGESGISLNVDVDGFGGQEGQEGREGHGKWRRALGLRSDRPAGGVAVTVIGSLAASTLDDWRAGRRVRFPVTLHRPSRYLDPGVPDHERALARRGISLVGTVKSGALVEVVDHGTRLDEMFGSVRAFARRAIAASVGRWNPQSGAIVAAIVIGDRAGLDDRVQRRLQEAGTYHVIAISGGNIAILAGLLLGLFRVGGWLGRAAMLSAIAALCAYARLVGGGASVDRATLMAVVHFGARAFDQRSPPLNALAVVAALLVAVDPLSVADPAFVLTCGATVAIITVVPVAMPLVSNLYARPEPVEGRTGGSWFDRLTTSGASVVRSLVALFAASVAAEAMLFPVSALVFSRVTFAGLVLNFFAIPLMAVAQIAGMALVPIALVSPAAAALIGWIAHVGAAGLVWSADFVRFLPILSYRIAPPAWSIVLAYYVALGAWWLLRRRRADLVGSAESSIARRSRRAAACFAVATAVWILLDPRTILAARGDGRLHVTFVDVGQGDAIFVVFPHGATLLVDAGGLSSSSFDVGDRVVAPVIRDAGFYRLDYVALTHGDPDHINGAVSILEEFRPREIWEGIPVPRSAALTALRQLAHETGSEWRTVYAGTRRVIDDVEVIVRHPDVQDWERQKVRNDDSLVLELRWRDVSILLTGDIGRIPERTLATTIPPAKLRVVKVPHHGSLTSSSEAFVRALRPDIAVVSAGRSNHFGHPVPEVLGRYRAVGAQIFRTDRDGAVMVDTDGFSLAVRPFTGKRPPLP
jgi:competence protein ComEC